MTDYIGIVNDVIYKHLPGQHDQKTHGRRDGKSVPTLGDNSSQDDYIRASEAARTKLTKDELVAGSIWASDWSGIKQAETGANVEGHLYSPEMYNKFANDFNSGLDKLPIYKGTAFRGLSDVPRDITDQWYNEGSNITFASTASMTRSRDVANGFSGNGWGENGQSVLFEIRTKTGRVNTGGFVNVTSGGRQISEQEIFARRGSAYKIISHDYYDKNKVKFPPKDYFEGTEYSWPNNPPENWTPDRDRSGYHYIVIEEQ